MTCDNYNPFEGEGYDNPFVRASFDLVQDGINFVINDDHLHQTMSPFQYALEIRTLRLQGRRRIGHTTTIKCLMDEYSSITVVPKQQLALNCYPEYQQTNLVFTTNHLQQAVPTLDIDVDLCLIDNASHYTQQALDIIYHTMIGRTTLFVQMQ